MKRRLVQQGTSTLMVSLPAKWTKKHSLTKGSEVDISELDETLQIAIDSSTQKKSTELTLNSNLESAIRIFITGVYRKGYDKIKVNFSNEEQFKQISTIVKTRLIGFDITKKEKNYCIIENITEPSGDQFENILQKVFLNIHSLFNTTEKRISGEKEVESFEEIEERIQKYDNFCRRVIIKSGVSLHHPEFLWSFLTVLIHGQRELYHLNKNMKQIKVSDKTKEFFKEVKSMFELIEKAYKEKNTSLLEKSHELEKKIVYNHGYKLLQEAPKEEHIIIYHLMSTARTLYLCNSPLLGILLM